MIIRARQWLSKAYVQCFSFRKNIMSANPRGVAALMWHHRCFISFIGEIVDVEVRLYVYDGQVLSEDYEWRDTSGNFFQFYCVPLQQEKRKFYTTFPENIALSYLNGYYLCKNI